jgi:hypothetical protein
MGEHGNDPSSCNRAAPAALLELPPLLLLLLLLLPFPLPFALPWLRPWPPFSTPAKSTDES